MKKLTLFILCLLSLNGSLQASEKSAEKIKDMDAKAVQEPQPSKISSTLKFVLFGGGAAVIGVSFWAFNKSRQSEMPYKCKEPKYISFCENLGEDFFDALSKEKKEGRKEVFENLLLSITSPTDLFDESDERATHFRNYLLNKDVSKAINLLALIEPENLTTKTKLTYSGLQAIITDKVQLLVSPKDQELATELTGRNKSKASCEVIRRIPQVVAFALCAKKSSMAATAHLDRSIRFYNPSNGECSLIITEVPAKIIRLWLSPSGKYCLTLSEENNVIIFESGNRKISLPVGRYP